MTNNDYPVRPKADASNTQSNDSPVSDALTGHDQPMEEKHPNAPAALVFASYPIVFAIGVVGMIVMYWLVS